MNFRAGWAVLVLLVSCAPAQAELPSAAAQARYVPQDDCAALPGARAFRAALAQAIKRRDADALAVLADEDVALDFGGGAGRAELRNRLRGPDGESLWRELAALQSLGCALQDGQMVLPWFFAQDLGGADPFEVLLVAGKGIPLRTNANAKARPLVKLSWQLVEPVAGDDPDAQFRRVRLPSGVLGFVETARLRSPLDYRLLAVPVSKTWRITALVAGD